MTRTALNITTVYSSAQCVLSVVGSVGVILLFAGIPQLIYSSEVSVANLMTFLLGAILITTMVAGNSFLNYKYRRFEREARERRRGNRDPTAAGTSTADPEDKPPSYDAILTSDGLPPDYYSILSEKPPRYEDITSGIFTLTTLPVSTSSSTDPNTSESITIISEASPSSVMQVGVENLPQVFQPKTITLDVHSLEQVASSYKDERKPEMEDERSQGNEERKPGMRDERSQATEDTKGEIESEKPRDTNVAQSDYSASRRLDSQDPVENLNESES